MQTIDIIRYGNPTKYQQKRIEEEDELTARLFRAGLYKEILNQPPPLNSSIQTQQELNDIVLKVNSLTDKQKKFCKRAEHDMYGLYVSLLRKHGINKYTRIDFENFFDKTDPFLFRIKYFYNRPRPYQLAVYLQPDLYLPIKTYTTITPAYPSGHAFEATLLSLLLSRHYPKLRKELMKLAKNISASRMYIGVHYKSDCIFGIKLARLVVDYVDDLK
jgi:hypothetical protein